MTRVRVPESSDWVYRLSLATDDKQNLSGEIMAKPVKYTERRTTRLDKETDELLVKQSRIMKIAPAVMIRVILERGLKRKLKTEISK